MKYFEEYLWKEGIPYGIRAVSPEKGKSYKIVMDPYRKRISIERYEEGHFALVVYDSAFLDFRHLKLSENAAWQKSLLLESEQLVESLIRDQDDRLLFIESYRFEKGLCRECHVRSIHGHPLSLQKMLYKGLNDPVDGVFLFDNEHRPVMYKLYETDPETLQFTKLLREEWEPSKSSYLKN